MVSHKNVTKAVWYILVQLSSLNNTVFKVSGVSVQVSVPEDRSQTTACDEEFD